MRFVLLGRTGQLGWELNRTLITMGDLVCLDYPEIDFADEKSLYDTIVQQNADVIINAAAYTAVDQAEKEVEKAYLINAAAPGVLARAAQETNAALIHFSTDFVFDGKKGTPYVEEDTPNPINVYGDSKLKGECKIQEFDIPHLIFRTSWLYSLRRDNFLLKVLSLARKNATVRVVDDQFGSPTSAHFLAEIVTQALLLIKHNGMQWAKERSGVYHLAGDGSASRYDMAEEILKNDKNSQEWEMKSLLRAKSTDFALPAQRPQYTSLSCEKFYKTFDLRLPDWRLGIQLTLDNS